MIEKFNWAITCIFVCFNKIGPARFRAPEVLFHPDLIGEECEGIHEALVYSIQKSDLDVRKKLYQSIVLAGGSTLISVSKTKVIKTNF